MSAAAYLLLTLGTSWAVIAILFGGYTLVRFVFFEAPMYRYEAYPLLRQMAGVLLVGGLLALVAWLLP